MARAGFPDPEQGGMGALLADLREQARRARAAVAAAFAAGLVLGWIVLGWWLFPVEWTDATLADLHPDARAAYVQLVADGYARDGDLARAQRQLASWDVPTLTTTLDALGARTDEPSRAQNARMLSARLQESAPAAAVTAAAPPAGAATSAASGSGWDWVALTRVLALAAALGAGLSLLGVGLWLRSRDGRAGAGATHGASGGGHVRSAATARDSLDDFDFGATALSPARGGPTGAGGYGASLGSGGHGGGPPDFDAAGAPEPRRRGAAAPPWRPARARLDQVIRAHYHAHEAPAIQTWLVYDGKGDLVGGAGLLAQPIGEINTLDLWFSDRDKIDQTTKTPTATFVSRAAYQDPVLRARLGNRLLVPAVPGQSVVLDTPYLRLDVTVESVEPPPHADDPSLSALALALVPRQAPPFAAAGARGEDEARWAADLGDGDVGEGELGDIDDLDGGDDEAFDPPRPLPFRRE